MFLFSCTLSFISSGVDDFSADDGWIFDEDDFCWYLPANAVDIEEETSARFKSPSRAPAADGGSGYSIKYPNFDINKIDVSTIPNYVQKYIYDSSDSCVFVKVSGSYFDLIVANGVCAGYVKTSGNFHLFYVPNPSSASPYYRRACYMARYSWSSSDLVYSTITTAWKTPNTAVLKTDAWEYYQGAGTAGNFAGDFYAYGVSSWRDNETTLVYLVNNSGDNAAVSFPGAFLNTYTSWNNKLSGTSFGGPFNLRIIPASGAFPSVEQQGRSIVSSGFEAVKSGFSSVIEWLKNIPTLIIDGIKSLFVPADGFFDSYFTDLKTFFAGRFGVLYDLPSALLEILQALVDYEPVTENYSIHFPEVKTPSIGADGKLVWHTIINEQDYVFDFLNTYPFTYLYIGYRSFIWLAYCFMLLNLIISRANKVFGGD